MKKIIVLALASLVLFSCKKDHSAATMPSGQKYPVVFNVTNFTQQQKALSLKRQVNNSAVNSLSDGNGNLDVLYYYVYTVGNAYVHRIAQDSTMADMGTIKDYLPAGDYIIIMAAGKKGLVDSGYTTLSTATIGYQSLDWQDTFVAQVGVTITSASNAQDITLTRIVTKLEVQATDVVPANASTITLAVYPEHTKFRLSDYFQTGTADTLKTVIPIPASAKGSTGFTFDKIIGWSNANTPYNSNIPYDVELTAKDASGNVIGTAHIPNITSDRGQKTVLSGKLFNGSTSYYSNQAFSVKVDTAWSSTVNHAGFDVSRNGAVSVQKTHF